MKGTFLCFFLFMALHAHSGERSMTFADFLKINESGQSNLKLDETIKISGFLYKDSNQNIFLSNTPDLKSCCVGHFKEGAFQIRLLDLPLDTAIAEGELRQIRGSLFWNSLEKGSPSFYLKKSELLDKAQAKPFILVGAIFGLFLISILFLKGAARYGKV
ncbi:hypothetical protein [Criblamydia sequanensis]|uniref:Membrane protein n=1 Tax=Candidatus Criblamydia sequanensis CRIB-18 TaxID=1437425 RepID=A0A090D2S1_9BACT|nr:hypothetical protein [Criblamydia sequanensis]CDR34603.1 Putative membrane protein [Criblamydia sequanensis CRIB-18]